MDLRVILSDRSQAGKKSLTFSHLYVGYKNIDLIAVHRLNTLILQVSMVVRWWNKMEVCGQELEQFVLTYNKTGIGKFCVLLPSTVTIGKDFVYF